MSDTSNQNLNRPIYINGNLTTEPSIVIGQTAYLLEKYDFDKIINGKNYLSEFKVISGGTSIGLFINMVSRFIGHKMDSTITFENWEIYAFIISLGLLIISLIIDKCIPSERKTIVKNIKVHFKIK